MRNCIYTDPHNRPKCTECGTDINICTCPEPDDLAQDRLHSPDGRVFRAIQEELRAARLSFPDSDYMVEALVEEVGELTKALMEHSRGQGETALGIFREAIQVATMAIRIATEGDSRHEYNPDDILRE